MAGCLPDTVAYFAKIEYPQSKNIKNLKALGQLQSYNELGNWEESIAHETDKRKPSQYLIYSSTHFLFFGCYF